MTINATFRSSPIARVLQWKHLLWVVCFYLGSNYASLQAQSFTESFDNIALLPGNGWVLVNASTPVGPTGWYQGVPDVFPANTGAGNAYIAANFNNTSGAGTISNWLMSPVRTFKRGDIISFYSRTEMNPTNFSDRLRLMFSANGASTSPADFTVTLLSINNGLTTTGYPDRWVQYVVTPSNLPVDGVSGRFALWYDVPNSGPGGSNGNYIGIDDVSYTIAAFPLPVNDLCADALPISCGTTVSGSSFGATDEPAAFTPCGVQATTKGVWYTFTGNGTDVTLSTCTAASFDTKISVYSGDCGAPVCVAGNDEGNGCIGFRSKVTFPTTNGTVYRVLIHGFDFETGTFDLTMTCVEVCPVFSAAPPNVSINNSTCNASCQTIAGSITAPSGTPCPAGSTLQYSVGAGPWTTTLPMYAGLTSTDSIKTRCLCNANPSISSPVSAAVSVSPANCADTTPPMATCHNQTITFNGQESIALNFNDLVTASDNCGIQSIMLSPSFITCQQVGQMVPVIVTVKDLSNNTTTCTSFITVGGLPCGWSQNPNGVNCQNGNSIGYNPGTGVWTATSTNCFYGPPFGNDASAFAQRTLCGDGSITALVTGINPLAGGWAGIVMRESNAAGAKKAQLMTNLSSDHRREFRTTTNGAAQPQQFPSQSRYWLRITRVGHQFTMFVSSNGINWFPAGAQNIVMGNCIQMGLVATNYTPNSTVTATLSNVSFTGSNSGLGAPLTPLVFTSIHSPLTPEFEVYPNPTGGDLNMDLTNYIGRALRIELYSLTGKLLKFVEVDELHANVERLDLSAFTAGIYLVKVKTEGAPDAVRRVVLR